MNEATIKLAIDLNIPAVDISGMGGTNFARIENGRRTDKSTYLEANWLHYSRKPRDSLLL